MYSVKNFREYYFASPFAMEQIVDIHKQYFHESFYREFEWREKKCISFITDCLINPDVEILIVEHCGCIIGYAIMVFTDRFQDEVVAMGDSFYILADRRDGKCSQLLLDFCLEICYSRSAKQLHYSSAAGFPDNGCNERAFRMLLKRNQFRILGTSLIREL